MGIAAYNRGSRAIAQRIADDAREARQGMDRAYFSTHEMPEPKAALPPMQGPTEKPISGYFTLADNPRLVEVGDHVFCTVSAIRCWTVVTEVKFKGSRRDLRIKTEASGRTWAYANNFTFCPPEWMKR